MKSIGIDIGTSAIAFVVLCHKTKRIIDKIEVGNDTLIISNEFETTQDANQIYNLVKTNLDIILSKHPEIQKIGFSNQMHGILYVDKKGDATSPLYTWKDSRGKEKYQDTTYVNYLTKMSPSPIHSGYGFVTHFYNVVNGLLDSKANKLCTIGDYVVMKLTNKSTPIMHTSNAQSLGFYNLKERTFDLKALKKVFKNLNIVPETTNDSKVVGCYQGKKVFVSLGDNQASFLGSVKDYQNTLLINIGSGSQVVYYSDKVEPTNLEIRPFLDGYLYVGAVISGGDSYRLLAKMFQSFTGESLDKIYEKLNNSSIDKDSLKVKTTFRGSRFSKNKTGSIENITPNNFTYEYLAIGFLQGMLDELFSLVEKDKKIFVGSGNGIRKNILLQKLIKEKYSKHLNIPVYTDEASVGAALFTMEKDKINQYIKYLEV